METFQILNSSNLGGGELMAINIADSLNKVNVKSKVLALDEGPAFLRCKKFDIPTEILHHNCSFNYNHIETILKIIKFRLHYAKGKSTVLHFHSPFIYGFFSNALLCSRTKTVVHVHLETDDAGLQWSFRHSPDVICVCAEFLKPLVQKNLSSKAKAGTVIKTLPNAVDLTKFHPGNKYFYREQYNIDNNVFFVLLVADLSSHKGHYTAIQSILEVKKKNNKILLWIVGKSRDNFSNYIFQLEKLISEMNLQDEVVFVGERDDIPELMRAADCLILPSLREGLPLVVLEAQASGLPVIASPISGIPEAIIDGKTGYLVSASDWKGYANKIIRLIQHPDLRENLSKSALIKCQSERNWNKYISTLLNIYSQTIQ